ncbi:MAG: hypothetical protein J7623_06885 [Chitinophaga sp.]|uniref:hypothetical protein n=1 Tax=Chitinophaga sp. TaxID=1869181 RepID=UPI001B1AAD0B|nr:hypothetical protein [Chitinophaga sp.]MBO9728348.1 hypothetical protein [Chitinophaga sp.]
MKRVLSIVFASLFLFSCGKKSDNNPTPSEGDVSWKLGDYTYVKAASSQTSTATDGRVITALAVTTAGNGGNYGAFSGSALAMTFYSNLGEGTYSIGTTEAMVSNPTSRILTITCTIGTAVNTGSILYSVNGTGGTANVTKDSNGKFHITVSSAVSFKKDIVVGGGIPAAKATYDLTIHNAW